MSGELHFALYPNTSTGNLSNIPWSEATLGYMAPAVEDRNNDAATQMGATPSNNRQNCYIFSGAFCAMMNLEAD